MTDTTPTTALPTFTWYPDPVAGGAFRETTEPCPCCGEVRGWGYTLTPFCVGESPENLCPWCIADGSAARRYASDDGRPADFTGDLFEVLRDAGGRITRLANPFVDPSTVPAEQREELATRTPRFLTWQEPQWLACCSTPAQYLGQPTGAELQDLDDPDNVLECLQVSSYWDADRARAEERLAMVNPEASEVVYLFRCPECGRHLAYSDMD